MTAKSANTETTQAASPDLRHSVAEAQLEAGLNLQTAEIRGDYAKLNDVLNAAKLTSIISTDLQGVITVFNSGAERMLGYAASEVIGKHTPVLFHLPSEIEARARSLREHFGHPVEAVRRIGGSRPAR